MPLPKTVPAALAPSIRMPMIVSLLPRRTTLPPATMVGLEISGPSMVARPVSAGMMQSGARTSGFSDDNSVWSSNRPIPPLTVRFVVVSSARGTTRIISTAALLAIAAAWSVLYGVSYVPFPSTVAFGLTFRMLYASPVALLMTASFKARVSRLTWIRLSRTTGSCRRSRTVDGRITRRFL